MLQSLNSLRCSTAGSVLAAVLWYISIGDRGNVSLISTQVTRHDNTCCSTCPLGILHRKVMIYFTEVSQETFLLYYVLFRDSNVRWKGRCQHKHLCKHVTKTGHVLLVCFTNSLHFLLQKNCRKLNKDNTSLCKDMHLQSETGLFVHNKQLIALSSTTVTSRKTSTHKIHSDQHSTLHSKLTWETPSCFSHS